MNKKHLVVGLICSLGSMPAMTSTMQATKASNQLFIKTEDMTPMMALLEAAWYWDAREKVTKNAEVEVGVNLLLRAQRKRLSEIKSQAMASHSLAKRKKRTNICQ